MQKRYEKEFKSSILKTLQFDESIDVCDNILEFDRFQKINKTIKKY